MRTAEEFDSFYARPDPWGLAAYGRRDRALAAILAPLIRGKNVLELGCGEGHLTRAVFASARRVVGLDISATAIGRAPQLPNAVFRVGDLAEEDLSSYDVIAAIECLYYLTPTERENFLGRLTARHRGSFLLMSPMIAGQYFTHRQLLEMFERHGIKLLRWKNVYVTRQPGAGVLAAIAARLPLVRDIAAAAMGPKYFRCHRLYVTEVGGRGPDGRRLIDHGACDDHHGEP